MAGLGIAWASLLTMPYAILSSVVPYRKMGVYMGMFNFFIVIPQILAAAVLGPPGPDRVPRADRSTRSSWAEFR